MGNPKGSRHLFGRSHLLWQILWSMQRSGYSFWLFASRLPGVKEELLENIPGCEIDVLRHLRPPSCSK